MLPKSPEVQALGPCAPLTQSARGQEGTQLLQAVCPHIAYRGWAVFPNPSQGSLNEFSNLASSVCVCVCVWLRERGG